MRIDNNLKVGGANGPRGARRSTASSVFHVEEGMPAQGGGTVYGPAPAAPLDALLALQSVDGPLERRRRELRRGRSLLDALDALKTDLLAGRVGEGHLNQLMALIGQARERTETNLDSVLDEIELRVRVELAKRGRFPRL